MHYARATLGFDESRRARGTGTVTRNGYIIIGAKGHPNATAEGKILQHVLVMSDMLGRPLVEGENVHHKNGVRDDNRPENLEIWNTSQPSGQRIEDKVQYALEILALYAPHYLPQED